MEGVKKKLREASFFCHKFATRSTLAIGDREELDFYLSAFLSAGRSVDYRLLHEYGAAYSAFRKAWDGTLSVADQALMKFMSDDRNLEIHEKGSSRIQGEERLAISGSYRDASGSGFVSGPPGDARAEIVRPAYSFSVSGVLVPVGEACFSYLRLLERMVNDYSRESGAA